MTSFAERVAYVLSVWFGCGLVPRMPGTIGTLGALPLYFAIRGFGWPAVLAATALVTAVGVWAAGVVARALDAKDPQIICVDEVAGVLLALAAAPPTWPGVATAVVLFRVFDMTKPWPARRLEKLPGGWGVVLDDVAAGVWAAALVLVGRALGWL